MMRFNRFYFWIASLHLPILVALALPTVATAQETGNQSPPAETSSSQPASAQQAQVEVNPARRSPQATVQTFMQAMRREQLDQAIACLDLTYLEAVIRPERGADLAGELWYCIQRIEPEVYLPGISDDSNRDSPYEWLSHHQGIIALGRVTEGQSRGEWQFTSDTLKSLDVLTDALRKEQKLYAAPSEGADEALPLRLWIREKIPDQLEQTIMVLEYWQWIGLLLLLVLGVILDNVAAFILGLIIGRRFQKGHIKLERKFTRSTIRPVGLLVMVTLWWIGLRFLILPDNVLAIFLVAVKFFAAFAGVWTLYRLVDLLAGYLEVRAARTANKFDDLLVPLVRKALKIFITVFGLVFIADTMQWQIKTLLAGLGIGGLAFAFAAKETLSNLLGSLAVLLDRPFEIGDWVIIGDKEGTVETVGFRSTRIRTFYNSLITIPNADCVNMAIDNMGARRYRRIKCMISVIYSTTPEQLEAFCEGIRELIRRQPYTRKDYFHVYVNQFAASSIDILLYCFVETPDWATELRERHRLFLDIVRLAHKLQVEFAFPTQTIHLAKAEPADMPLPPTIAGTDQAFALGQSEAEAIAAASLGEDGQKPPPVTFK